MLTNNYDNNVAQRLKRRRWALLSGLANQLSVGTDEARRRLIDEAKAAPLDPFCPEGYRQRYFHKGCVLDGQFLLEPTETEGGVKVVAFDQGDANSDFRGKVRRMPAIPDSVWNNPAYRELHTRCFGIACEALGVPAGTPFAWEGHLIRLVAKPGEPAVATPDEIHFDDDTNRMITFIIVIERDGVEGGVNLITHRRCAGLAADQARTEDIYFRGVIEQPFDGYAFMDSELAHYVSAIQTAPGALVGARSILIFDFVQLIREQIALAA